jgi:hypothetical protein
LLSLIIIFVICTFAFADLGNFNDYSSSGSGGWSSGSASSGSSDSYSDWDSSHNYRYSYSDSSPVDMYFILIILVVAILIFLVKFILDKAEDHVFGSHAPAKNTAYRTAQNIPDNTQEIIKVILTSDPDFSSDKFLGWAKEVFITLQTAWSKREWEKVRPFEKEELYRQHELQIKEYIDLGRINVLERININNAYLFKYKRDAEYEYLSVFMNVRMVDYIIDEKTKAVLKGDPNKDCFLQYILTFIRKKGVLTSSAKGGNSIVSCPKCGAPTRITSAGKCEYCGFIVTTGEYSWVLADIEGVKPSVHYGKGGVIINEKGE